MEVKIGSAGGFLPKTPAPEQKKSGGDAASFASALQSALPRGTARRGEDFSAQTPDEVFASALRDSSPPDLERIDDYLEWRIAQEK